jgi:hypothetical protein
VSGTLSRATLLFLWVVFFLLLGVQLVLYRDSFAAKPSNDDFISLHQVDRGEERGIVTFFVASDVGDYRPLQNVTFWIVGRWSRVHRLLLLRILHFASSAFYAAVLMLWTRTLGFSRSGVLAAACVVFLHPLLAGTLAGFDNYSRLVASALIWLGTWAAFRWAERPVVAVPIVGACFMTGLGYMEYAIALVPLAVVATAWRGGPRRLRRAGIMLVSLLGLFVAYFLIRVFGLTVGGAGADYISTHPIVWIKNLVMMLVAVLFFGNTVQVMMESTARSLGWMGLNAALTSVVVASGLWLGRREAFPRTDGDAETGSIEHEAWSTVPIFLSALFVLTFIPTVLMKHISEIYLSAMIPGLALLAGVSAQGWALASRPLRYAVVVFSGVQCVLAAGAIQAKVTGMNEVGERAASGACLASTRGARVPPQGRRRAQGVLRVRDAGPSAHPAGVREASTPVDSARSGCPAGPHHRG